MLGNLLRLRWLMRWEGRPSSFVGEHMFQDGSERVYRSDVCVGEKVDCICSHANKRDGSMHATAYHDS